MKNKFDYDLGSNATDHTLEIRDKIIEQFMKRPMPDSHLFYNMGLFMSSSNLAKILFLDELYQHILYVPGAIVEFGTWWGQNQIVFENLRAIYEPFNRSRRIIGFDTFSGYERFSEHDKEGGVIRKGGYSTSDNYDQFLRCLASLNESHNILGNTGRSSIVKGDVMKTVPDFFDSNPEVMVALAYFDLALYKPTRICMETISDRLIPGSVIMLDEFNSSEAPGETLAFREVFSILGYKIKKSRFLTDRTMVIFK